MKKNFLLFLLGITVLCALPATLNAQIVYMTDGFENGFSPTCDASCKTTAWTQEYYDAAQKAWVSVAPKNSQSWKTELGGTHPDGAAQGKGRAYFRNEPDQSGRVQTAGYRTRLITPVMDLSQGYQPILRFYHAQAKYTGDFDTLKVYYRSGEGLQWQLLQAFTSTIKNWKFEEISLPAVGEFYQIAFEANENLGRGIVLDSVLVRTRPQITTPHDITFTDMRDQGVTIQWQASMDADYFQVAVYSNPEWDLNVQPTFIDSCVCDTTVDSEFTQVRVDSLESGGKYYVQVRSLGETENSVWSEPVALYIKPVVYLPYFEDFELPCTSNLIADQQLKTWIWGGDYQPIIPLWIGEKYFGYYSPDATEAVAFVATKSSTNGEFTAANTYLPAGSLSYLISPEIASKEAGFSLNQCHVSFWGTLNQATDDNARSIIVGVLTDATDPNTFVPVDTCTIWGYKMFQFFDVDLSGYQGDGRYIAFVSNFDKTNQFYLDKVTIEKRPAIGTVLYDDIHIIPDTTSALVSWEAVAGANSYQVKVAKLAKKGSKAPIYEKDMTDATILPAATNSLTLSGLTPASKYVVSVYSGSTWSQPKAFFTSANKPIGTTYSFEEDEGTYNIGEAASTLYPASWMIYSNDPEMPHMATTYKRSGNYALNLTKNIGAEAWVVAPIVDTVQNVEIKFYCQTVTANTGSRVSVGVMTDPSDPATYVKMDEFTVTTVFSGFYSNFLTYTGKGRYIALRWEETGNGTTKSNLYIDDVVIRPLGKCMPVTGLQVLPTDSSALLTWNASDADEWQVKVFDAYMNKENIVGNGNVLNIDTIKTNTLTLNNLNWGYTYYVYVRPLCGDSEVEWTMLSFDTDCPAAIKLPYKDDFERYTSTSGNRPTCWTAAFNGTSTTYPYVYSSTTYAHSGEQCLYMYAYTTYGSFIALPPVDADIKEVILRAYTYSSTSGYVLYAGVMDDPNDWETFTKVDSVLTGPSKEQCSFSFANYQGQGKYIALSTFNGKSNSVYVDDVELIPMTDAQPFGFTATSVGSDSITATWQGKTSDKWQVLVTNYDYDLTDQYELPATLDSADIIYSNDALATQSVTVKGLTAQTTYYFYVRSTMGSEWGKGALTTECVGLNPRVRYTESFEDYGKTVIASLSSTSTYIGYYKNAVSPICWTVGCAKFGTDMSQATSYTYRRYFPYVCSNGTGTTATTNYYDQGTALTTYHYSTTGYNSLMFYGLASAGPMWAAMPRLECEDADLPMLVVTGSLQMSTTASNALIVGVMDDPEDLSTFVVLDSITGGKGTGATNGVPKSISFEVSLQDYTGTGRYIAFRTPYGKSPDIYLDDVTVSLATCMAPNISFTQVTDNSARVLSGLRGDNAWKYYLSLEPFSAEDLNKGTMPADSVVIDSLVVGDGETPVPYAPLRNLLPDTTYYVAMAAICESGTSAWKTASFKTLCTYEDVATFGEGFSNYETTSGSEVGCWTVGNMMSPNNSTYIPYTRSYDVKVDGKIEKHKMLYLYAYKSTGNDAYAIMPGISFPEGKSLKDYQLRATVYSCSSFSNGVPSTSSSNEYRLLVGVVNTPSELSSITYIDTITYTTAAKNTLVVPFDHYTGNGSFVVLVSEALEKNYSYILVDTIALEPIPACVLPTKLVVDTVGEQLLDMHWTGTASQYEVALTTADFTDDALADSLALSANVKRYVVNTNSAHITDLTPNATYRAYVRGICGENETSEWSVDQVRFRTDCYSGLAPIPFVDDFEDYMQVGSGTHPQCYSGEYLNNVDTYERQSTYPYVYVSTTYANSGSNSLYLYGYLIGESLRATVVATPDLAIESLNQLQINFYARGTKDHYLYVGTVAERDSMYGTFVPFDSVLLTGVQQAYTINMDTVNVGERSNMKHVAFCTSDVTTYIDDINIRWIPSCFAPKATWVDSIAYTSAMLHITPNDSTDTAWQVRVRLHSNDSVLATLPMDTADMMLSGLQPSTTYVVEVRTDCGEDKSEWADAVTFTTLYLVDTYTFHFNKDEQGSVSVRTPYATSDSYMLHPALSSVSGSHATSYAGYPYSIANSTAYAYALESSGSTEAALKFASSTTYDSAAVILPVIIEPEKKQLSFYLRGGYAYASDYSTKASQNVVNTVYNKAALSVGLVDSAQSVETFQELTTIKPSTLVKYDTLTKASNYGWQKVVLSLANVDMAGKQLALMMHDCGSSATMYVDNLAIDTCRGFNSPLISGVDVEDTCVTVHWQGDPAREYTVYMIDTVVGNFMPYLQDAPATAIDTITGVHGNSYKVNGLMDNTTYSFYVEDAAAKAIDPWGALSNRIIVTTTCRAQDGNGYAYGFEPEDGFTYQWPTSTTASDTAYKTPECWNIGIALDTYDPTSTTYKSNNPTMMLNTDKVRYSLNGNGAFRMYGTSSYSEVYAVLPLLNVDKDTTEVQFYGRCFYENTQADGSGKVNSVTYLKGTDYSTKVAVGTMTNPTDYNTFVALDTIEYSLTNEDLTTSTVVDQDPARLRYFQKFTVPLAGAQGKYIAFRQVGYGYFYMDDISLQKRQTARAPHHLEATDIDTTHATLTWIGKEEGGLYRVQYMKNATVKDWTNAITVDGIAGNSVQISGLSANTKYTWRVCQFGTAYGESDYAHYEYFTTDCLPFNPNGYYTGFECSEDDPAETFYTSGTTQYKKNQCWSYINQGTATTISTTYLSYNIPATSTLGYGHSGQYGLKLYASSDTYQGTVVTPYIDAEIGVKGAGFDTLQVSFWGCPTYYAHSGAYAGLTYLTSGKTTAKMVEVGTCTDPDDPATYTVLDTCIYECEDNILEDDLPATAENDFAFQKFTVKLRGATGPYVFIRANKNRILEDGTECTTSTMYIDDFQFETLRECLPATGLTNSTPLLDSVILSWNADDAHHYAVEVSLDGKFADSTKLVYANDSLTVTSVRIDSLLPTATYYYRVRRYCSADPKDGSDWSRTNSFKTPYVPLFNEAFTTTDYKNVNGWAEMKGYAKDVFNGAALEANTSTSDYNSWYRLQNNVMSGYALRMSLFYAGSTNIVTGSTYQKESYFQKYWLVSPAIAIQEASAQLVFDAALTTYEWLPSTLNQDIKVHEDWASGWDDQFMVIVSEDGGETWKRENATIWNNETTNDTADAHYRYGIGDYRLNEMKYEPHKVAIDLNKYQGKTIKVAFYGENTWQNANEAVHIDNVHINYAYRDDQAITLCQYEDVNNVNGFSIDGDSALAGVQLLERYNLATKDGAIDSVFTLNVNYLEAPEYNYEITVCEGTPFEYMGFNEHSAPGTYRMKLTSEVTGCDSIVNFTIKHAPQFHTYIDTTICEGSFIELNGKQFGKPGTFTETLQASEWLGGCDSLVTLNIAVTALKRSLTNAEVCYGETYTFNGKVYDKTGVYNDTIATESCDSIATLSLLVRAQAHTTIVDSILHGEVYEWAGQDWTESCIVNDTLTDQFGCDSIVTLQLLVKYADVDYTYAAICEGGSYEFNGKFYDATGTYYDTTRVEGQADMVEGLVLTVRKPDYTQVKDVLCAGETYTFGDTEITTSGVYTETYQNQFGCDSVVELSLTVAEVTTKRTAEYICEGDTFLFAGHALTESGIYYDTIPYATSGCDSLITVLELSVAQPTYGYLTANICYGTEYLFGGQQLTASGTYVDTIVNTAKCDSIVTLTLTVDAPLTGTKYASFVKGCSYTYNGVTYNQAGEYIVDTLKTENGCDSVITLILSEAEQGRDTVFAEVCPGEYYIDADFNTNVPGTHETTVMQEGGCEIIRVLVLTNKDNHYSVNANICQNTSYSFRGQEYSVEGEYEITVPGAEGECDSIFTLTLHVITTDTLYLADTIGIEDLPYLYNGEVVLEDTVSAAGIYHRVLVVAGDSCSQVVDFTITVLPKPEGFNETVASHQLTIRPNIITRSEYVTVVNNFSASERAMMKVELCDILGHTLPVSVPQTGDITIGDFPAAGVYTLRITTDSQTFVGQIIVQN
ncbi:MAG: hypothetical protein ACI30J_01495 [Paludibacteraceae bacterium]